VFISTSRYDSRAISELLVKQAWPFLYEKFSGYAGQTLTIDNPLNKGLRNSRLMMHKYDGVAKLWFESEEDLMEAMG
jgi:hypothetical protein